MMYMDKPFKKNTAIFHKNKNVIFLIHGDFKLSRNKRFSALKVHNIIDSEGNSQPNLATLGSTLCVFPHVGVTWNRTLSSARRTLDDGLRQGYICSVHRTQRNIRFNLRSFALLSSSEHQLEKNLRLSSHWTPVRTHTACFFCWCDVAQSVLYVFVFYPHHCGLVFLLRDPKAVAIKTGSVCSVSARLIVSNRSTVQFCRNVCICLLLECHCFSSRFNELRWYIEEMY